MKHDFDVTEESASESVTVAPPRISVLSSFGHVVLMYDRYF